MEIIKLLRENVEKEEKISSELSNLFSSYGDASPAERDFLENTAKHLLNQIEMLSEGVSAIMSINSGVPGKKLEIPQMKNIQRISTSKGYVAVKKEDKSNFLKEIKVTSNLKKGPKKDMDLIDEKSRMPSRFSVVCARLFRGIAKPLSRSFGFLDKDLKQADMPYIVNSYVSLILGICLIAFLILVAIALIFSQGKPLFIIRNLAIAIGVGIVFFIFLLYYPKTQASSNSKKMANELPFALAHMAAIASSKIEPSKMFYIMARASEYKLFSQQMKKVVNQMNLYGYNLTTSLRNVAKLSSSREFSEFLNGMATTVLSGGDLTSYIHEKSRDMMLDYKLARERYSVIIGMYSDVYTALLIAAPLILMLVLSFMGSIGQSLGGFSLSLISNVGIIAIVALNILFLLLLHLTQPEL